MEKEQFLRFKEDLKAKAQEQRELKNQRKTEHFKGERTINPYDAAWKVRSNRFNLDKEYVIYYILKHRMEITEDNLKDVLNEAYHKTHISAADYEFPFYDLESTYKKVLKKYEVGK